MAHDTVTVKVMLSMTYKMPRHPERMSEVYGTTDRIKAIEIDMENDPIILFEYGEDHKIESAEVVDG